MSEATCPYCESEISATAKKCRSCGEWVRGECSVCGVELRGQWAARGLCGDHQEQPQAPVVVVQERRAPGTSGGNVIAGLASFFLPGLGQLSQGRLLGGIAHFFLAAGLWIVALGWIVHVGSAIEAARYNPETKHKS